MTNTSAEIPRIYTSRKGVKYFISEQQMPTMDSASYLTRDGLIIENDIDAPWIPFGRHGEVRRLLTSFPDIETWPFNNEGNMCPAPQYLTKNKDTVLQVGDIVILISTDEEDGDTTVLRKEITGKEVYDYNRKVVHTLGDLLEMVSCGCSYDDHCWYGGSLDNAIAYLVDRQV